MFSLRVALSLCVAMFFRRDVRVAFARQEVPAGFF